MASYCFTSKISGAERKVGIRRGEIKRPAIFLDRDGTIIRQVEFLHLLSEVRLLPGAARAIKQMNDLGYLVIVATNQSVVARGMAGLDDVDAVHELISYRLAACGAHIDAFYYCPHHPEAAVKKYRVVCDCRKPAPGMIFAATKDFTIDLKRSFFIGDTTQDALAAHRAKIKMILVKTGHGGRDPWQYDVKPDFVAQNLSEAIKIIKK